MTEKDRHGTGKSGWCLAQKRCHECTYAACDCGCHGADKCANPPVVWENETAGKATSKGAGNTPRGLTTGGSTPDLTERN